MSKSETTYPYTYPKTFNNTNSFYMVVTFGFWQSLIGIAFYLCLSYLLTFSSPPGSYHLIGVFMLHMDAKSGFMTEQIKKQVTRFMVVIHRYLYISQRL